MAKESQNVTAIGFEPATVYHLQAKGFQLNLFTFFDQKNFLASCAESKAVFIKWDGAQKKALHLLEQLQQDFKKSEAAAPTVFLIADKNEKEDKVLKGSLGRFKVAGVFSLPGEMHKVEMTLFELTGQQIHPDDQPLVFIAPDFAPIAYHQMPKLLKACRSELDKSKKTSDPAVKSFCFFARNPEVAANAVKILRKQGRTDVTEFSDAEMLLAHIQAKAPDVLMVYHEKDAGKTQTLLDGIASIRNQAPAKILVVCPGESAIADFESCNRTSWFDQKIISALTDKGFKLALEKLDALDNSATARGTLLAVRRMVIDTNVQNVEKHSQEVWQKIVKLAGLPGRKYWAKLEHMYFYLAGGSNKSALEEVTSLMEMNPSCNELQLVRLNLLASLGRDLSTDLAVFEENFTRSVPSGEDLIGLARFGVTAKQKNLLKSCIEKLNTESRKDDPGFHYLNAAYANLAGDKVTEGHWLRSALALAPMRLLFMYKMALHLGETRDYFSAIKLLEMCREVAPDKKLTFELSIAEYLFLEGARMRAEQRLATIMKEFPGNPKPVALARKLFPESYESLVLKYGA